VVGGPTAALALGPIVVGVTVGRKIDERMGANNRWRMIGGLAGLAVAAFFWSGGFLGVLQVLDRLLR
jgi:hypothetical protein